MLDANLLQEARARRGRFLRVGALQALAALCAALAALALAVLVRRVYQAALAPAEVAPVAAALLSAALARSALLWRARLAAEAAALDVAEALRQRLLAGVCGLGPVALASERRGELAACLAEGIEQIEPFFAQFLPRCTAVAAALPVLLCAALWADGWTALLFLCTAPLAPLFLYLIGGQTARAGKRQWEALSAAGAQFLDLLEGLTTLRLFGQSAAQKRAVDAAGGAFAQASLKVLRVAFLSAFALELTATLSIAFVAVSVSLRLLAGQMELGRAFFLLLLAPLFYEPLRSLGAAFHSAVAGSAAAPRLYGFACVSRASRAPQEAARFAPLSAAALRFEDVRFRYGRETRPALDGFSLAVEAGSRVAFLGRSGAGKSTLFRLLLRFAPPEAGEIYIDGRPLSSLAANDARRCFSYLPQRPHIFAASVAENIALAQADATREEVVRAAKQARAHEWICALPEGYDTKLGAGGRPLSGGQLRRVALARAFLRDAPVLLLDECQMGLDAETAAEIERAVARLAAGRTVLEITHRLSAARAADTIVVVESGRVAECGAHEALLARGGAYAALWLAEGRREA